MLFSHAPAHRHTRSWGVRAPERAVVAACR